MISESKKTQPDNIKTPVIVISSHLMGYGVIRSLGMHGVPVDVLYYNEKDFGYVSKYVNRVKRTVFPEADEIRFIEDLINFIKDYDKCLVIPADDDSVNVLSKHIDKIPKQVILSCQSSAITDQFIQKYNTYQLAEALNIPYPKTKAIPVGEFIDIKKTDLQCPCLLKPNESHLFFEYYKKKMYFTESHEKANYMLKTFKDQGFSMLLQEFIPGPQSAGVNHNIYAVDGNILVDFTAEKVRTAPTEFSIPRVVVSKDLSEIREYSQKLIKAINFSGYACIEYKKDDRDNQYKFMEINGRFNRSSLLSVKCGINFPMIMYRHMVYGIQPKQEDFKKDVYWIDLTQDIFKTIKFKSEEGFKIKELIRPYLKPKVFAILNYRDLRPFIKRLTSGFTLLATNRSGENHL